MTGPDQQNQELEKATPQPPPYSRNQPIPPLEYEGRRVGRRLSKLAIALILAIGGIVCALGIPVVVRVVKQAQHQRRVHREKEQAIANLKVAADMLERSNANRGKFPITHFNLTPETVGAGDPNLVLLGNAMRSYAIEHGGRYPASMAALIRDAAQNRAITSADLVLTESGDKPLKKSLEIVTDADLAGHCSYVYVAGEKIERGSDNVLMYEKPTARSSGIGVLFAYYRVGFIPKKDEAAFLKIAESGSRPVHWP